MENKERNERIKKEIVEEIRNAQREFLKCRWTEEVFEYPYNNPEDKDKPWKADINSLNGLEYPWKTAEKFIEQSLWRYFDQNGKLPEHIPCMYYWDDLTETALIRARRIPLNAEFCCFLAGKAIEHINHNRLSKALEILEQINLKESEGSVSRHKPAFYWQARQMLMAWTTLGIVETQGIIYYVTSKIQKNDDNTEYVEALTKDKKMWRLTWTPEPTGYCRYNSSCPKIEELNARHRTAAEQEKYLMEE